MRKHKKFDIVSTACYVLKIFFPQTKSSRIGEVSMRKIIVGDASGYKCSVTFWKNFIDLEVKVGDYLLLKSMRVGVYNGNICLSTLDTSLIMINPTEHCKELDELKAFVEGGVTESSFVMLSEVPNENESDLEVSLHTRKIDYIADVLQALKDGQSPMFTIKATCLEFEHGTKNFYFGCPNQFCKKKLVKEDEEWFCKGCNTNFAKPSYYYTLTLRVIDLTKEHSINLYGDLVTTLFGVEAETYISYVENNEIEKLKEISKNVEYQTFYLQGKASKLRFGQRVINQLFIQKFEREDYTKNKGKLMEDLKRVVG